MAMKADFPVIAGAVAMLLSALAAPAMAADLRVSGAATVANGIVLPHQAAIEQETGLKLLMVVNGDGNGLKDLYAGRSDVAMVAAPMKVTEDTINRIAPGSLDTAGFQLVRVGSTKIHFVINPANPVKSLTAAQLRDIFTGKIASWKDVGGNDAPIVVVAEAAGLGTRANVVTSFLSGTEITPGARTMQGLVQLVQVTGQVPDAISYGNDASINGSVSVIPGVDVEQVLGMATNGKPGTDAEKLIAAVAKYGAAAKE
jgi:phosphate transport system substrate-binding protein